MRILGSLAISLTIASCASKPSVYDQRRKAYQQERLGEKIYPCGTKGSSTRCGFISDEIWSKVFIREFVREACVRIPQNQCTSMFWDMWFARLGDRYPYADWSYVGHKCKAYPVECRNPLSLESWIMESHNEGVDQVYDAKIRGVDKEEEADLQKRREQRALFWQQVGAAMGDDTNCVSRTVGNRTYTSCD